MAIYRYPPEVHEFVKKWASQLRDDELADVCNMELGTDFTASRMMVKDLLSSRELYWI